MDRRSLLWQSAAFAGLGPTRWTAGSRPLAPPADFGWVSPTDFGARGDGAADDTAAFQQAADRALAAERGLVVPPGAYRLNGTVTVRGDRVRWWQDYHAEIRCYSTAGPAVKFAGVTTQMNYLVVDGLRVSNYAGASRRPLVQFGDANGCANLVVRNVLLDGRSLPGDGILLEAVFNAVLEGLWVESGGGGVGVTLRSRDVNIGNIQFANTAFVMTPIGFLMQEYTGDRLNLINSLHFNNCKVVRDPTRNVFFAGRAGAGVPAGARALPVGQGQGAEFTVGEWVVVTPRGRGGVWPARIAGKSGDTLSLTDPLPFPVENGDYVTMGNWHTVLGDDVRLVRFTIPHCERVNGVLGVGAVNVVVDQPELGTDIRRVAYLTRACQDWVIDGATGPLAADGYLMEVEDESSNSRNVIRRCGGITGGAGRINAKGGSFAIDGSRFGAGYHLLGVWHQDRTVSRDQRAAALAGPSGAARPLRMLAHGGVVGLVVSVSRRRSGGRLTAEVYKNGEPTGLTAVIDGDHAEYQVVQCHTGATAVPFAPGDAIDVRVTTDSGWGPDSAQDLDVQVFAEQ